ncbi:MAG TPA: type III-A CRISPR-associated RAMP protein Csm4 [Anaerolineaceae bacterium]|nr:type III-A CRISPR-associated RAMP protein Csm4 [Anaerolineaceae bacterium]
MPELTPHHLEFRGGLHMGTKPDLEEVGVTIPSDTLFSAMLMAWLHMGRDPAEFALPFLENDPPFLLTSAFPRAGDVRFYPIPANVRLLFANPAAILDTYGKQIRKVKFISEGLLLKFLHGEHLDPWLFPKKEEEYNKDQFTGLTTQSGTCWMTREETRLLPSALMSSREGKIPGRALYRIKFWEQARVPHVQVDRINQASTIYHIGRLTFTEGCGLWFGIHWIHPEGTVGDPAEPYRQAFTSLLADLAIRGLGGERSSGYGAFLWQDKPAIQLPDPVNDQPGYLLSRYHPSSSELPMALTGAKTGDDRSSYNLVTVGGHLQTLNGPSQRRKRLTLVAEGGIICPPRWPAGNVMDVKPDYQNDAGELGHPVYRFGWALAAGLPSPQKEAHHG